MTTTHPLAINNPIEPELENLGNLVHAWEIAASRQDHEDMKEKERRILEMARRITEKRKKLALARAMVIPRKNCRHVPGPATLAGNAIHDHLEARTDAPRGLTKFAAFTDDLAAFTGSLAFTIGRTSTYEEALQKPAGAKKLGKHGPTTDDPEGYGGGIVWKTREEAEAYLKKKDLFDFSVYALSLPKGFDEATYPKDGYSFLLVDAPILRGTTLL